MLIAYDVPHARILGYLMSGCCESNSLQQSIILISNVHTSYPYYSAVVSDINSGKSYKVVTSKFIMAYILPVLVIRVGVIPLATSRW